MTRRKGELSAASIDRGWPHQVALPADEVTGANHNIVHGFCRNLSLCERGYSVQRDGVGYVVFCFADRAHAELFRTQFNGERFDPKDRGRGSHWHQWANARQSAVGRFCCKSDLKVLANTDSVF